jgi:TMEM199 family protein
MVLLTITPTILSALNHAPATFEPPLEEESRFIGAPISHSQLVNLGQLLRSQESEPPYTLASLLRGSKVYVPPLPPKPAPVRRCFPPTTLVPGHLTNSASMIPKAPEYLALKASLLAAQEQSAYDSMLPRRPVSLLDHQTSSDSDEDNISVSLVLNILLSIVLCGFAAFWATRYWGNMPARVGLSFVTGIVVGVAEVGVYAGYLRRVELSKRDERKRAKREKKEIVEGEQWSTEVRSGKRTGAGGARGGELRARRKGTNNG